MFDKALSKIKEKIEIHTLSSKIEKGAGRLLISGLNRGAKSFYISLLASTIEKNIVYIASSEEELNILQGDFHFFYPLSKSKQRRLIRIPPLGTEPYQSFPPHSETLRLRMRALWELMQAESFTLLTSIDAFMLPVAHFQTFCSHILKIKVGDEVPFGQLFEHLDTIGYRREDMVEEIGDYSVRGGIVDLFSPQSEYPFRLEYLGDYIESIRTFDPIDQRSLKELEPVDIIPLREIIINKSDIARWIRRINERWQGEEHTEEIKRRIAELKERLALPDIYYLAPLVKDSAGKLLHYLRNAIFVMDEPQLIEQSIERLRHRFLIKYQELSAKGRTVLKPEEIISRNQELFQAVNRAGRIDLQQLIRKEKYPDGEAISINCQSLISFRGNISQFIKELKDMKRKGVLIILQMTTSGQARRLSEILQNYHMTSALLVPDTGTSCYLKKELFSPGSIVITTGKAQDSFYLPEEGIAFITEESIFGPKTSHRQLRKGKLSDVLSRFRDLKEGEYVVHLEQGIGRYKGLRQLKIEGKTGDFIEIEYQNQDKLYLPIDGLDQIYKYSSSEAVAPPLNRLGGATWSKVKRKVKKGVEDLTNELLSLYAARMAIKGFAFGPDTPWQKEFEASFEYIETPDQAGSINEIKKDMESDKSMDRLLCGDVGYGKTEVAMRAAFKAVMNAKQVAILAPTTVLVFQHYRTFRERFRSYPVEIEMLSRFRSRKEQKKILSRLKQGTIDIVVGTHRLLSADVKFFDLGLLIIDEEQRFGVSHKERIKHLRQQVDVLTMTATPIPRTLNMAISGVRDLSLIETPPENRLAIQTYLIRFDADIIRAAILQELQRDGQVYFVHNRIENISALADFINRICPDVRLGISHGRMPEKDLENEMLKFIDRKYDILLTTAIIENGLDIPSVNTIIINRADRFGLAQLYQLRGRVGRSQHKAYAYLVVPSESSLSSEARERLKAIQEFTQLGSGFRLAAWDLEIRGAGNLLGAEQHGHIAAVGFDMYCRLMEEAVKELKGEPLEEEFRSTINLGLDIYIPTAYIPDSNIRLMLYRQVSSIRNDSEIEDLELELRDRYGKLPSSMENLLSYLRLKILAEQLKIKSIDRKGNTTSIKFSHESEISGDKLVKLVANKGASFSSEGSLRIEIKDKNLFLIKRIKKILQELL